MAEFRVKVYWLSDSGKRYPYKNCEVRAGDGNYGMSQTTWCDENGVAIVRGASDYYRTLYLNGKVADTGRFEDGGMYGPYSIPG